MRRRRPGGDRGSIAVELAFVAPLLLLLVALVAAYGRVARVNGVLEAGTRDAARSASQARTLDDARDRAREAVEASVGASGPCAGSLVVDVTTVFAADAVRVSARCTYPVSDLGLPGLPGTFTARSSFSSPVDPNRGGGLR